jgi:hypothetical protein
MAGARLPSAATTLTWQRGAAFVAQSRNLVVVRWTGVPTGEQLAALARAHRAATACGGDVLLVNEVALLSGPPRVETDARAQMLALIGECRDRTRAVAHVIEIPGVVGLAVRTFLRAIESAAGKGRTRTRTFDRMESAASWLAAVDAGAAWSDDQIFAIWRGLVRGAAPTLAA